MDLDVVAVEVPLGTVELQVVQVLVLVLVQALVKML